MKLSAKAVLIPTLVLFLVSAIVTAVLAGTNALTADTIAQVNAQAEQASRQVVLPDAQSFEEREQDGNIYYIGKNGEETVGYVFTTESNGYGGAMSIMTGISADGQITGINILSHNDTPGLGANATNESFRDQYKKPVPQSGFSVIKSGSPDDTQILAMTGATITTDAVTNAVNLAVQQYETVKEEN